MRTTDDRGETLLEIVLTIIIIGITITALVSGLATASSAANSHRANVTSDAVMRNFAEAAKLASRRCTSGAPLTIDYSPPEGYVVAVSPETPQCPAVFTTTLLHLTVTTPVGHSQQMEIRVRTP